MSAVSVFRRPFLVCLLTLATLGTAPPASAGNLSGDGHTIAGAIASSLRVQPNSMGAASVATDAAKRPVDTRMAAQACPSGQVWRERFDGDTACVLPGERDENRRKRGLQTGRATACPSGLVWRERFDGDTVCVLPGERDENRRNRRLSTGPASACPSGLVWRERFDGDTVCVPPRVRDENRRARGL